jgi:DNA-binding IclR family transcriptional regulator
VKHEAEKMPTSDPAPERRRPTGDAVLTRAFALLDSFDEERRSQTLASLARRTGLPRSTALRLARKLVEVGALEQLKDGSYVVGLHLLEIASLAPRGHGLRQVALPYLEDLFQVTGQHVLLAVRDGDEALLVERLSAHDASPVRFRVGGRMPLASTGAGLALLAYAPAAVQERALSTYDPALGDDRSKTPEDLRRALGEIRRGGYALGQRANRPRTTAAAPIRHAGAVVAAVSVVASSADFDMSSFVPAVRGTALAISRELTTHGRAA